MAKTQVVTRAIVILAGFGIVTGLLLLPNCGRQSAADFDRPNVVLLIIDALRADLFGCYGFPKSISPEIDAIAEKGVIFENVVAQCSWTRPSIGSMITSEYPRTLGIYKEQFDILPDKFTTMAEILQEAGYTTLGITANPNINNVFNFDQGFDAYIESRVVWDWMKREPDKKTHKKHRKARLRKSAETFKWVLKKAREIQDGPVYVQINIMEVHSPYLVRNRYKRLFKGYPVKPHSYYDEETVKANVWGALAAVRQVSEDTGKLIDDISSLPGWNNTLFIITSDHGQGLDDHPDVPTSLYHGNLLYESQMFVPLILYNPADSTGVPPGRRVTERIRLLDLMPTVLDYLRMPVPDEARGISVLALASGVGKAPVLPDAFFVETNWREVDKIGVYTEKWKYFENRDGWKGMNPFELQAFNVTENGLLTDEIQNNPEEAAMLRETLRRWEEKFPRSESVSPIAGPSDEEVEQLKSLGYFK